MEVLTRPVVVTLGESDAAVLARQLVEAIRLGYVSRGAPPPRLLLDFASEVSRTARGFASVPVDAQVSASGELSSVPAGPFPAPSGQPVWLTAQEAARIAEVSVQTMRRCLREGDPSGSRGHRSVWRVDASELAAWLGRRRRKLAQKAA